MNQDARFQRTGNEHGRSDDIRRDQFRGREPIDAGIAAALVLKIRVPVAPLAAMPKDPPPADPHVQDRLHSICRNGFEHHVGANLSQVAPVVHDAATRYVGWEVYWHKNSNSN
jgi:hypothetical protein